MLPPFAHRIRPVPQAQHCRLRTLCGTLNLFILLGCAAAVWASGGNHDFRFVIVGDRTGGALPGVYHEVWREAVLDHPAFAITVGDTIEGLKDGTADSEWKSVLHDIAPFCRFPVFFTPGNHDVWSAASARSYVEYSGHPLHYSFDYENAHFTVLDNSLSDQMPPGELTYLESDLAAHAKQPLKFVFMHRPSWIMPVVLQNPDFPLERLAKRWGVQYVIAGHIHQMLHFDLDGVTYLSIGSSGGHLRDTKQYDKGWFYQHTLVTVHNGAVDFTIKEVGPPWGHSRVTGLSDWGVAGLASPAGASEAPAHASQ